MPAQARWRAEALDWHIGYEPVDEVVIVAPHALDDTQRVPPLQRGPGLVFGPVAEDKQLKNPLHIDLAPLADGDQPAEVGRLEALGARRAQVGERARLICALVLGR